VNKGVKLSQLKQPLMCQLKLVVFKVLQEDTGSASHYQTLVGSSHHQYFSSELSMPSCVFCPLSTSSMFSNICQKNGGTVRQKDSAMKKIAGRHAAID
jgi:hypothetical protein